VAAEARALEACDPAALPLYGVPVAVKDNIDVAGVPTTAACRDFARTPEEDAGAVARLRAAGALVIGKTNLDQFATGLVGVRSPFGAPRNTFRADLVPGGSSSGSAVAVAAGIVPLALGTDTAGSGRVPAGLNNVVGLKPTCGLVSTRGVVPACRSLDCVSIFALTVEDAHAALTVLAGFDDADPFSRRFAPERLGPLPQGLRVGVPNEASRRFGGDPLAAAAFETAVHDLAGLGASIEPVDLQPFLAAAALLYDGPWVAERYHAVRTLIEARPDALLPVTRAIIERARDFTAADAFAGRYRLAELRRATEPAWHRIDILAVPTVPRPRTLADLQADPIGPNAELGTYTNFVNLLDLCALAVPGRRRGDGLPSGVTLIAPAGHDGSLAALGARLHRSAGAGLGATGRPVPAPADLPCRAGDGEIELAVVGAHLSGQPLNRELTVLGGRFLRAVPTLPDYRLFALEGSPPARPGLLRVEPDRGHAIETEVWALDPAGFGRFVAGIPAPLAVGTLHLADGTRPKGFIVESAAVGAAQDISSYGGWRAYRRRLAG
jgi:allophanate hydrolase